MCECLPALMPYRFVVIAPNQLPTSPTPISARYTDSRIEQELCACRKANSPHTNTSNCRRVPSAHADLRDDDSKVEGHFSSISLILVYVEYPPVTQRRLGRLVKHSASERLRRANPLCLPRLWMTTVPYTGTVRTFTANTAIRLCEYGPG